MIRWAVTIAAFVVAMCSDYEAAQFIAIGVLGALACDGCEI